MKVNGRLREREAGGGLWRVTGTASLLARPLEVGVVPGNSEWRRGGYFDGRISRKGRMVESGDSPLAWVMGVMKLFHTLSRM